MRSHKLLACFHAELHDLTDACHDKVAAKLRRDARRMDNQAHADNDRLRHRNPAHRTFLSTKGQ